MSDPFASMVDTLFTSAMKMPIDYYFDSGFIVQNIPSLVRRPDLVGDLGNVRVSHRILIFEIRVDDLVGIVEPDANDLIRLAGEIMGDTWRVQSKPTQDRLELIWMMSAYKL